MAKTVDRENLVHRKNNYNFKIFQAINTFGREIYKGKTTLQEAIEDQDGWWVEITSFKKHTKLKSLE